MQEEIDNYYTCPSKLWRKMKRKEKTLYNKLMLTYSQPGASILPTRLVAFMTAEDKSILFHNIVISTFSILREERAD